MTTNLLVVDWDFFFPMPNSTSTMEDRELYDWTHSETTFHISSALWDTRGSTFLYCGRELPMVTEDWRTFWDRFNISGDAQLFVAESNSAAASPEVADDVDGEVWLYDAHHDCGYNTLKSAQAIHSGRWSCEEWMILYGRKVGVSNLHTRYPLHRDQAFEKEPVPYWPQLDRRFDDPTEETPEFHKVFVCRSGAWVPSWCDRQFDYFVDQSSLEVVDVGTIERTFDRAHVEKLTDFIREWMRRANA
jgi:hypothetical protein